MNRSSMSKQMMQEGGKVKPKKKLSPAEAEKKFNEELLARRANESAKTKAAEEAPRGVGNMPLSDAQALKQVEILKAKNKDKEVKKMNMGGMTGSKKPMMPPKPKPAPTPSGGPRERVTGGPQPKRKKRAPMGMDQDSGGAMPRMKKGGKVRGCGMARGGSVRPCKMVKMKGA